MDINRSKEIDCKQLGELIADVYDELHQDYEVLSAPDGDNGIFKYIGSSPEAKFFLSKMSKKRGVQRPGIGFVIQRAEFSDRFRIAFDLEITQEVIGKDSQTMANMMNAYSQTEFGIRALEFIIYRQPAHSGKRGWNDKTFIGIEIDITDRNLKTIHKLRKRIIDIIRKLFQTFDFALLEK